MYVRLKLSSGKNELREIKVSLMFFTFIESFTKVSSMLNLDDGSGEKVSR